MVWDPVTRFSRHHENRDFRHLWPFSWAIAYSFRVRRGFKWGGFDAFCELSVEGVDDIQVWGSVPGSSELVVSFSCLFPSYLSSLSYIEDNASFKYGGVS